MTLNVRCKSESSRVGGADRTRVKLDNVFDNERPTVTKCFPQPTGCAKGTFVRAMATEKPERNYLGLEIRRPTAAVALERVAALGTRNCHVVCCNANVRDTPSVLLLKRANGRGEGGAGCLAAKSSARAGKES